MSLRHTVAAALVVVLGTAGPVLACGNKTICSASALLSDATCCFGNTCTLDGTITLSGPTCGFDFGARTVTLSGTMLVGSNTVAIEAGSFRTVGSGLVNARGTSGAAGGIVTITLTGNASPAFSLGGGSGSGIDASGFGSGGGVITVAADGPVSLTGGALLASNLDTNASGGTIVVTTSAGGMTVGTAVRADAGVGGSGGSVDLEAPGNLSLTDTATVSAIGGEGFGGEVDLAAGGALTIAGNASIKTNAQGGSASDGGDVNLLGGSIMVSGIIDASGGSDPTMDVGGSGGTITLEATSGAIQLLRTTESLTVDGAGGGEGGEISFTTDSPTNGAIGIGAPVSAQGHGGLLLRPAGGGLIEATAAAGLTITKSLNVSGFGEASGVIDFGTAQGDLVVQNDVKGLDPAGGGEINLSSGHDLVVSPVFGSNIRVNAGGNNSPDGPGGEIALSAENDLSIDGYLVDASGAGTGPGGGLTVDAGRNMTITASTVLRAKSAAGSTAVGGTIALTAGAADVRGLPQTGTLKIDGDIDVTGHAPASASNPASVTLTGCDVVVSGSSLIDATGDVNSANVVTGRASITFASGAKLKATSRNTAVYRTIGPAPAVAGAQIQPSFTSVTKAPCTAPNTPAGCLVPCPACGDAKADFPEQCDPPGCPSCDQRCRLLACADGNPCTTDACDPVFGCRNEPVADGTACTDANACTIAETCQLGVCTGETKDCDDGLVCTTDTCDAATGCHHAPVVCPDDGNQCNGAETCSEPGGCHHGTFVVCPVGKICDPPTGTCVVKPCATAAECNDGNPCTADSCSGGTCSNTPVPNGPTPGCGDSNLCNGTETCQAGICTPGTPPNCDDGQLCTNDTCDPTLGCLNSDIAGCCLADADCGGGPENPCAKCSVSHLCTRVPNCCVENLDCDDESPCTTDTCSANVCQHTPLTGPACGDACNPGTCQSGTCDSTPISCQPDADICTEDFCDPAAGCMHVAIAGCCSSDAQCDDHDACTEDGCDPDSHVCFNNALFLDCSPCATDTDCDALGACGQHVCDTTRGVCVEHTPPNCTDGRPTTQDICVVDGPGAAHCEHPCFPGACDDGKACNGVETCAADGSCVPGTPPTCDDGDACTRDTCDDASGCTHVAEVGYASIRCRLDTVALLLQTAGPADISKGVLTKISRFLGKARVKLDRAERAGSGRPALKALKAAGKQLKGLAKATTAALKKKKIGTDLGAAIGGAAKGATDAIETVKASTTP